MDFFVETELKSFSLSQLGVSLSNKKLKTDSEYRLDGRTFSTARPMLLQKFGMSETVGSAIVETDHTKVAAYVFGPSETFVSRRRDAQLSDNGAFECLVRFAPFANSSATDPAAFIQSRATTEPPTATDEEQQLSSLLVEALSPAIRLECYQRSAISVFVSILEDDGAVLAACITAASTALANAGILMFDLVVSVQLVVEPDSDRLLVDPTRAEERSASAALTYALLPTLQQCSLVHLSGVLAPARTRQVLEFAKNACGLIHKALRLHMLQLLQQDSSPPANVKSEQVRITSDIA